MASLYESLFGFGIFGIITLIVLLFVIVAVIIRNINLIKNSVKLLFVSFINLFTNFFKNNTPMIGADNCAVVPGTGLPISRVPSTYLAHIVFFFAFLFTNAYTGYNLPKEDGSSDEQYENRKNRTSMIMAMLVLVYIAIVAIRFNVTGCESHFGILFTTVLFGGLGVGLYKLAEQCGARMSDILGITTSFVHESAKTPIACA